MLKYPPIMATHKQRLTRWDTHDRIPRRCSTTEDDTVLQNTVLNEAGEQNGLSYGNGATVVRCDEVSNDSNPQEINNRRDSFSSSSCPLPQSEAGVLQKFVNNSSSGNTEQSVAYSASLTATSSRHHRGRQRYRRKILYSDSSDEDSDKKICRVSRMEDCAEAAACLSIEKPESEADVGKHSTGTAVNVLIYGMENVSEHQALDRPGDTVLYPEEQTRSEPQLGPMPESSSFTDLSFAGNAPRRSLLLGDNVRLSTGASHLHSVVTDATQPLKDDAEENGKLEESSSLFSDTDAGDDAVPTSAATPRLKRRSLRVVDSASDEENRNTKEASSKFFFQSKPTPDPIGLGGSELREPANRHLTDNALEATNEKSVCKKCEFPTDDVGYVPAALGNLTRTPDSANFVAPELVDRSSEEAIPRKKLYVRSCRYSSDGLDVTSQHSVNNGSSSAGTNKQPLMLTTSPSRSNRVVSSTGSTVEVSSTITNFCVARRISGSECSSSDELSVLPHQTALGVGETKITESSRLVLPVRSERIRRTVVLPGAPPARISSLHQRSPKHNASVVGSRGSRFHWSSASRPHPVVFKGKQGQQSPFEPSVSSLNCGQERPVRNFRYVQRRRSLLAFHDAEEVSSGKMDVAYNEAKKSDVPGHLGGENFSERTGVGSPALSGVSAKAQTSSSSKLERSVKSELNIPPADNISDVRPDTPRSSLFNNRGESGARRAETDVPQKDVRKTTSMPGAQQDDGEAGSTKCPNRSRCSTFPRDAIPHGFSQTWGTDVQESLSDVKAPKSEKEDFCMNRTLFSEITPAQRECGKTEMIAEEEVLAAVTPSDSVFPEQNETTRGPSSSLQETEEANVKGQDGCKRFSRSPSAKPQTSSGSSVRSAPGKFSRELCSLYQHLIDSGASHFLLEDEPIKRHRDDPDLAGRRKKCTVPCNTQVSSPFRSSVSLPSLPSRRRFLASDRSERTQTVNRTLGAKASENCNKAHIAGSSSYDTRRHGKSTRGRRSSSLSRQRSSGAALPSSTASADIRTRSSTRSPLRLDLSQRRHTLSNRRRGVSISAGLGRLNPLKGAQRNMSKRRLAGSSLSGRSPLRTGPLSRPVAKSDELRQQSPFTKSNSSTRSGAPWPTRPRDTHQTTSDGHLRTSTASSSSTRGRKRGRILCGGQRTKSGVPRSPASVGSSPDVRRSTRIAENSLSVSAGSLDEELGDGGVLERGSPIKVLLCATPRLSGRRKRQRRLLGCLSSSSDDNQNEDRDNGHTACDTVTDDAIPDLCQSVEGKVSTGENTTDIQGALPAPNTQKNLSCVTNQDDDDSRLLESVSVGGTSCEPEQVMKDMASFDLSPRGIYMTVQNQLDAAADSPTSSIGRHRTLRSQCGSTDECFEKEFIAKRFLPLPACTMTLLLCARRTVTASF